MKRRKYLRLGIAALAGLIVLGLLAAGFRSWGRRHVREVTGSETSEASCLSCHRFGSGDEEPSRPEGRDYPSPSAMSLSADGARLYVSCEGSDEVVVVDPVRSAVVERWPVGSRPMGLAVHPDGERLFVALRGENRVVVLDARDGQETASQEVGRFPCGLALDSTGSTLVVANSGSDDVSVLDAGPLSERARLEAGREPYAVTISADGRRAYVANRLTRLGRPREVPESEVTIVDLERARIVRRPRVESAHLSEGIAVAPDGSFAVLSLVRVRNLLPITQVARGWVMTSGLGWIDSERGEVIELPTDEVNRCFADPSGVALDADRARLYVASGGGNAVTIVDLAILREKAEAAGDRTPGRWADDLGVASDYVLARVPVGANPRALLLDGRRLWVAERLGDALSVIDTDSLTVVERVELGDGSEIDEVRRGEMVFHDASITFQKQFSCRSCHPDGHQDGLTYDFDIDGLGRNIVDNRSLLGLAGTAPFKWNGKNEDLHEQCGPRFARVLTRSDPFSPEQLDSLVAYLLSLPPPAPRRAPDGSLTAAQRRGQEIFERSHTNDGREIPLSQRCTTCHRGSVFTNRILTTVDTSADTDTSGKFDTPHLLGIADSAPYLHDGRALTLEEIWTVHSPDDLHGTANDLSKEQLNDLVEYLKAL